MTMAMTMILTMTITIIMTMTIDKVGCDSNTCDGQDLNLIFLWLWSCIGLGCLLVMVLSQHWICLDLVSCLVFGLRFDILPNLELIQSLSFSGLVIAMELISVFVWS